MATPDHEAMLSENKDVIRRHFEDAINQHDASVYDEIMTENYSLTVGLRTDLLEGGRAGYQAGLKVFWSAFPDMRVELLDLIAESGRVVAHYIERATNTGGYAGHPPTGLAYEKHGIGIYTVTAGRMSNGWVQEDDLAFLASTGINPAELGASN
jgi:predicted ester cyclase